MKGPQGAVMLVDSSCADNYYVVVNAPRIAALDQSLGFNLHRVAQLYRRELIRALADFGLTPEQWQILAALSERREGLTQGEIATLTFKDKHSVSRMLDRMESAGWIARLPHAQDARAFTVRLTRRRTELRAMRAALRAHFARIDRVINDEQRRQMIELLAVLRAGLED